MTVDVKAHTVKMQGGKELALSGPAGLGKFTLVDEDVYEVIKGRSWFISAQGYAIANFRINGKKRAICLHILVLSTPRGMDTDHINGDKLDNRRCNLRIATRSQNMANVGAHKDSLSAYKGVHRHRTKWQAVICHEGKKHRLGSFLTQEEAARAYNEAAITLFGPFAATNEIQEEA